jgi:hypothetical protein
LLCTVAVAVVMIVAMRPRDTGPPDDGAGGDGAADEARDRAAGDGDMGDAADEGTDDTDTDETSTDDGHDNDDPGGADDTVGGDPGTPLDGPPDADTLADAVALTRGVAAARVELTTAIDGPAGPVVLAHRAAFVDGGLRASAESDLSEVARALGDAGQQLEGDWTHPARVVVDGGTVFSQLGPMAEALGHAPEDWSSAELADLVGSGAVADNDTLALALDPLGPLDQLLRPVIEIGEVGGAGPTGEGDDDEVRGAAVRHLRASLDLTGTAGAAPAEGSFEARLVAVGVDGLPVDVWLDGAGVIRRLVVSVEAAGGLKTTFDVYDVGDVTDSDVAPPPTSEVIAPPAAS